MFKPGKNRDGYFDAKELIAQVNRAIDIFKDRANSAQGLFLFNNAPSHMKRAANAISAIKMVKSASDFVLFLFLFVLTMFSKIPSTFGRRTWMDHACAIASTHRQESGNRSTSQMTTPVFQGGSKVWSRLSASVGFGPRPASPPSALAPSLPRARPAVAVSPSLFSA